MKTEKKKVGLGKEKENRGGVQLSVMCGENKESETQHVRSVLKREKTSDKMYSSMTPNYNRIVIPNHSSILRRRVQYLSTKESQKKSLFVFIVNNLLKYATAPRSKTTCCGGIW